MQSISYQSSNDAEDDDAAEHSTRPPPPPPLISVHVKSAKNQVRSLLIVILLAHILVHDLQQVCFNQRQTSCQQLGHSPNALQQLTKSLILNFVVVVAAADAYSDASAEAPTADALEDDDDDDEELDASASNEYPDGENDNDESYDDAEDDRQETRLSEVWLAPNSLAAQNKHFNETRLLLKLRNTTNIVK